MNKKMIITIASFLLIFGALLFFTYRFTNNKLKNTSWQLNDWQINDISATYTPITLTFQDDSLGGLGGVNSYGAKYGTLNNLLIIKDIYQTEMASSDPVINQMEGYYFDLLAKVKYYKIDNDNLKLSNSNKEIILTFIKK